MTHRLLIALVALFLMSGCAASLPDVFVEEREAWTQDTKVYDGFETRLEVRATLKTASFRRAYVKAYAQIYDLDPGSESRLLEIEVADGQRSIVILAAVYTPDFALNHLARSRGIWEVRLENSAGNHVRPSIRRLNPSNPTWARLFPQLRRHETLYELRFERITEDGTPFAGPGEPLELVISGAPAKARLRWTHP